METRDKKVSSSKAGRARKKSTLSRLIPYRQPQLTRLGSLSEMTLGFSPGVGDSDNPLTTQP